MNDVQKRIQAIESRNTRVEKDKAWETSLTRKMSVAGLTYVVVVIFLWLIGNDEPFINALVPVVGFLLSTLVLGNIREMWERRR